MIRSIRTVNVWFVVGMVLLAVVMAGAAEMPFVHPLFTDHMMLQREVAAPVWGWTTPGATVTVNMDGKTVTATADANGKWLAKIGPFAAGGPYALTVAGPQTAAVKDVLVGDVWLCSGQSNMRYPINPTTISATDLAGAQFPQMRLFTVPTNTAVTPKELVNGAWSVCTPQTLPRFSAVGFFFGRQLHRDLHVPIGLIHSSWGGTVAEAWTSKEALLDNMPDDFADAVKALAAPPAANVVPADQLTVALERWMTDQDTGLAAQWQMPAYDDVAWKPITLPGAWQKSVLLGVTGLVWFRKDIELAKHIAGTDLTLSLGQIANRGTVWFNGELIGTVADAKTKLKLTVPGKLVKAGRNVLAVRVLGLDATSGFISARANKMSVEFTVPGQETLPLTGNWKCQVSKMLKDATPMPKAESNNRNRVTVLYNGMIAPLLPFAIKGAIWYQGEHNATRAKQYQTLLPTMITDWRNRFGVGDFPFFIVQLANYRAIKPQPAVSLWAELREAQLLTALKLPKTGLAVTIDIGEADDIHPRNKQEVGRRLALAAEAIAYGKTLEYSGPLYQKMKVDGNSIRLTFTHLGDGLVCKGEKLKGFAIAGADKKFVWADAVIDGDSIVVTAPEVTAPVAVRYAWADNPICNLYNAAGLPASPFRTDEWDPRLP